MNIFLDLQGEYYTRRSQLRDFSPFSVNAFQFTTVPNNLFRVLFNINIVTTTQFIYTFNQIQPSSSLGLLVSSIYPLYVASPQGENYFQLTSDEISYIQTCISSSTINAPPSTFQDWLIQVYYLWLFDKQQQFLPAGLTVSCSTPLCSLIQILLSYVYVNSVCILT